jgi:hypothetical protein
MRPENPPSPQLHCVDANYSPRHCPNAACPSRTSATSFEFQKKGRYLREVDRRSVQRFQCSVCGRCFSSQTFRIDYRYHRPRLHLVLFPRLVAKCSLRQAARELCCHRDSILIRLARLGPHAHWVNIAFLEQHRARGQTLENDFQLDELETFEVDRRLFPVTVPVLVQAHSRFVVHLETATLPARGNLRPRDQARLAKAEERHGKRESKSKEAVTACFNRLKALLKDDANVVVWTDKKATYPAILRDVFGERVEHLTVHSKDPRGMQSPLKFINSTFAMLRDGLGRLVRKSWGYSKLRRNLAWHMWIWALYRNFVREWVNRERGTCSAQVLGIVSRRLTGDELLEWIDRLPSAA